MAPGSSTRRPAGNLLRRLNRPHGLVHLFHGNLDLSLIRLASVTPWGDKVFLVPFKPNPASSISALPGVRPALATRFGRRAAQGETLGLFDSGGGGCCSTPADIEAQGTSISSGGSGSPALGAPARVILVVPDGVAKVSVLLPRQAISGEPAYKHPLTVTAPVHNNVAAFQVNHRSVDAVGADNMIWYGPSGNIVKTIGDPRGLTRVVPPPKPAPETALSRRAERDPSTPNPVLVVPRTGGPTTTFTIKFRLLFDGAYYETLFSGPGGPGCHGHTPSRGGGGGGGGPTDVRGQIWSEPFGPSTGAGAPVSAWCPGTYHVKVSAFDVPGRPRRFYPPFGTATFTVHR